MGKTDDVMFIATLSRQELSLQCHQSAAAAVTDSQHKGTKARAEPWAKALWIVVGQKQGVQHDPCRPDQVPVHFHRTGGCYSSAASLPPSPPLPPTVCLPSPLACYQARYGADGVPPFSIGRAGRVGVAKQIPFISFVARASRIAWQLATETGRLGNCRRRFAQTITVTKCQKKLSWKQRIARGFRQWTSSC